MEDENIEKEIDSEILREQFWAKAQEAQNCLNKIDEMLENDSELEIEDDKN